MEHLAYKCKNHNCGVIFKEEIKEDMCCVCCGGAVTTMLDFPFSFARNNTADIARNNIEEFRNAGLLWFVNNLLHVFGWAIVVDDSNTLRMYPARVKYRGFNERDNDEGYMKVSQYMKDNAATLLSEIEE